MRWSPLCQCSLYILLIGRLGVHSVRWLFSLLVLGGWHMNTWLSLVSVTSDGKINLFLIRNPICAIIYKDAFAKFGGRAKAVEIYVEFLPYHSRLFLSLGWSSYIRCHESGEQMGWVVVLINYFLWITTLCISTSQWISGLDHDPGSSGDQ